MWKLNLNIGNYLTPNDFGKFESLLRIPVSGSVLLTKEVRKIIDTPQFQRLKGVRQLGPTYHVFPGANHTRFEHSLGVYHLALKYLENLSRLNNFNEICKPIDETIKIITLSALLHDIGHYPYSHWIEELNLEELGFKNFKKHEDRAADIIKECKISQYIEDEWKVELTNIIDLIKSKHKRDKRERFMTSIISSIIDIDKVDYLRRDSIHCGVDYGLGIDLQRLLNSLHISDKTGRIGLTHKGRTCLLSIITCRIIMYQQIYWHKTVRACDAMFKRFFYEFITRNNVSMKELNTLMNLTDDQFIDNLYNEFKSQTGNSDSELLSLLDPFRYKGRRLYKPGFVYFHNISNIKLIQSDTRTFFTQIFKMNYEKIVETSNVLAIKLKKYIPNLKERDIIIETTPVNETIEAKSEWVDIYNTKIRNDEKSDEKELTPVEILRLDDFLEGNKQCYIFCNPKYYDKLKNSEFLKKLNKTFEELI